MKLCRRLIFCSLSIALLLALVCFVKAQSFSLEQVTNSPFPSELTVSKRGDKVAWAFDAEGKRNVWIAEGPSFASRQLTHYDSDDGQELSDLVFSPSGNAIAFVRGQGKNPAGEYPNPTTDPAGAKQEVWVVDVRIGRTTKMGEGNGPVFNSAGDQMVWIREGHFWTAPVIGGKERKLFEMRGNVGGPQWSPDGSQLAFSSTRGDHSFISIYDTRANRLRFLSPSTDRDIAPRWSSAVQYYGHLLERPRSLAALGHLGCRSAKRRRQTDLAFRRSGQRFVSRPGGLRFLAMGRRESFAVPFGKRWVDASLFDLGRWRRAHGLDSRRIRSRKRRARAG